MCNNDVAKEIADCADCLVAVSNDSSVLSQEQTIVDRKFPNCIFHTEMGYLVLSSSSSPPFLVLPLQFHHHHHHHTYLLRHFIFSFSFFSLLSSLFIRIFVFHCWYFKNNSVIHMSPFTFILRTIFPRVLWLKKLAKVLLHIATCYAILFSLLLVLLSSRCFFYTFYPIFIHPTIHGKSNRL